jgi:hypothetical protein
MDARRKAVRIDVDFKDNGDLIMKNLILVSALALTAIGSSAFAKSPETSQSAAQTVVVTSGTIYSSGVVISQPIEGAVSSQAPVALTSTGGNDRLIIGGGGRLIIGGGGRLIIGGGGRLIIGGGGRKISGGAGRLIIGGGGRMIIGGGG